MGRISRFAPAGLLLAGIILSGCQFQLRDDWEFIRGKDDPEVGMDYAAKLQARKKQQSRKTHKDSDDDDASDTPTGSAGGR
jgi:hypothetical protein